MSSRPPVATIAAPESSQAPVATIAATIAAPESSRPAAATIAAPESSRPVATVAAPESSRPVATVAAESSQAPVATVAATIAAPEPSRPVATVAAESSRPPVATIAAPETLRAYDRWAAHYDQDDNPLVAVTGWRLVTRPLQVRDARVVELGCGTGRHAPLMLDAGAAAYTGVDGSAGMLAQARQRVERRADAARCQWLQAELDHLPAWTGPAYDAALIVLVIEHLAELAAPLTALAGWLRPGATLRLLELHPDRVAAGTVAHFHADGVEQRFASVAHPVSQLVETLGRCGFEIVTVDELLAEGPLLELAPRLAKHRGHPVVLDLVARRSGS